MKYNGKELIEMIPEKWDGNRKFMLVWRFNNDTMPQQREVVEWYKNEYGYVIWRDVYNDYWNYCAEIPKEEQDMNYSIDDCIVTIESFIDRSSISSWQDLYRDITTYLKSLKELKEENEKLKAKVKALNSSNFQTHCGMHNVIAKLEEKIANLKKESEELEEKNMPEKKTRRMTYCELAEWLAKGNGFCVVIAKDIDYPVAFTYVNFTIDEANDEVPYSYKIRGWHDSELREPLIEE